MRYKGIELTPITRPQIFDPPRRMLVWDYETTPIVRRVWGIAPGTAYDTYRVHCVASPPYAFCAEIPEEPKPKRVTNIQLMKWLAKGNGVWRKRNERNVRTFIYGDSESLEEEVEGDILIQPFDTTEWLEPTPENMGIGGPPNE